MENKFIESISYGTLEVSGDVGFDIVVSGEAESEGDLANALLGIYHHPQGKSKIVQIHGTYTIENTPDMFALIESLKSAKYTVIVVWDGVKYWQWFKLLKDEQKRYGVLVVETSNPHWSSVEIDAFRYVVETDDIVDPTFPKDFPLPQMLLCPDEDVSPKTILHFIKNSKHIWGVRVPPTRSYMELVEY